MVRARTVGRARARHRADNDSGGADARVRILDAAEELFAERGYDATSTAGIAERAGVAKGLLFYYFPRKSTLLTTLFAERLPSHPLCGVEEVARRGDLPGSLVRLAGALDLDRNDSQVLRAIMFREANTHAEARSHLRALSDGLRELTERVLDAASPRALDQRLRRAAADVYVAVLLHGANAHRYAGTQPDLSAAADIVATGLLPEA